MPKIVQLSPDVISKIAAGEVIERPSYGVKELIENSLDAEANVIEINIEESGLKKIQVIDNGIGMSKEDLELCFFPHTTSKLKSADELLGIRTLGFRGEALSSIASISQLVIQSRTKENPGGTMIEINKGKKEHIGPIGMPIGTIVTVNNLFQSVPARKKFLKSAQTEFRHITDTVMRFVLNFPEVHFILTHNKKTILNFPAKTIEERIAALFGEAVSKEFLPINYEESYIRLHGALGKPHIASKNNNRQFIFVNNRYVTDKIVSLAVKEAFGTLIPASNTPVFRLHISLPFEMVDVNVHPRKEQVAFIKSQVLFDTIKHAVATILSENNITFNLAQFKQDSARIGETQTFAATLLKEKVLSKHLETATIVEIIQLYKTYLLVLTKEGYTLFDQHAAHERILYEQFIKAFKKQKKKKEQLELKKPLPLHLGVLEAQVIEEYKALFIQMGFEIEHFSGTSFLLRKVPVIFKGRNIQKIIDDMLTDLSGGLGLQSIDTRSQRMLAFLSCRAAVMAGEEVLREKAKKLIKELQKTPNNTTCPHGRPTQITVTKQQLDSWFKRR